jgi:hypothetical protein
MEFRRTSSWRGSSRMAAAGALSQHRHSRKQNQSQCVLRANFVWTFMSSSWA